jgi:hypothetical protein
MPDWLNPQPYDEVIDIIPTHVTGRLWASLTDTPGPQDIKRVEAHLRNVGRAIYENTENIRRLNSDIDSMSTLMSRRLGNFVSEADRVHDKLLNVSRNIDFMKMAMLREIGRMEVRLNFSSRIDDRILTEVLPAISEFMRIVNRVDGESKKWMGGVEKLTHGYLSPLLVPETEITRVLRHVREVVFRKPEYAAMKLMSDAAAYYYRTKTIVYTHVYDSTDTTDDTTLYVTLKIPMYRTDGGVLPVYRVDVYPVPDTAGLRQKMTGFTVMQNLPDFIAVAADQETYVEMNATFFLSCSGDVRAKTCGAGMPLMRKRRAGQMACAFAVFIEDAHNVRKYCDIRYGRWKPWGSAYQLAADSTFLIHASQRTEHDDSWTMSCPSSASRPQWTLESCDMCRVTVPCFCSLSTADFYLPLRVTNCDVDSGGGGGGGVSFLYHVNTALIHSLYPNMSQRAEYLSYRNFTEKQNLPFSIPPIRFAVADNFSQYASVTRALSGELKRTVQRAKDGVASYENKMDAALNRTRDFSDQVVDRAGDISKAFLDFFDGIFGYKIGHVLALVVSPVGLCMITMVFNLFDCIPGVIDGCRRRRTKKNVLERERTFSKLTPLEEIYKRNSGQKHGTVTLRYGAGSSSGGRGERGGGGGGGGEGGEEEEAATAANTEEMAR